MNSKTWPTGGIQELIRDRKGDRSYDQLAHESDYVVKSANIQRMATSTPSRFPDPVTIRAIAKLMRCTEHEVVMACATSLGLSVGGATPVDLVIRGAGRYSPLSQRHILEAAEFAGYWEASSDPVIDKDSAEYRAMSVEERIAAAGVTEQGQVDLAAYAPGGKTMREQQEEAWAESEDQSPEDPDHVA